MAKRFGRAACFGWLAGMALAGAAAAQAPGCAGLRWDLDALGRAGAGQARALAETMRRQRVALDRAATYARSIGCDGPRDGRAAPNPAACAHLDVQAERMAATLAALDNEADRVREDARRRADLAATYAARCLGESLAVGVTGRAGRARLSADDAWERAAIPPDDGDASTGPDAPDLPAPERGATFRTLCVRACDGYYFPLSPATTRAGFERDAELCAASCPNARAELYVHPVGQDAERAVSLDGRAYASLPTAFRFRKAYDPACGCRRPGESWADTLADAERVLREREPERDRVVAEPAPPAPARVREERRRLLSAAPPALRGTAPAGEMRDGDETTRRKVRVIAPLTAPPANP